MAKILHVLNGDSSLALFQKTKLTGDTIVWREMLSEGRSDAIVGNDNFWRNRKSHLYQEMGVSEDEYERKVISEFKKLEDLSPYEEVVLWFEYDLFCQVNLMAALSYLKQFRSGQKISLICVGKFSHSDKLLGLGQLDADTFESLFEKRVRLGAEDLNFADGLWEIYSSSNHQEIKVFIKKCPESFEYLPLAMAAHLKRFTDKENGLNNLEYQILKIINEQSGNITVNDIVREFLINDQIYGLGDLIYLGYLEKISLLYNSHDKKLSVNQHGIDVLNGKTSFSYKRQEYYFGGSSIKAFYWNAELENVVTAGT